VKPPPREILAAETRRAVDLHDEWDSLHCFMTLHWDGEKLTCGTYAAIDPAIKPTDYPALMAKLAREAHEKHPDDPPAFAYLLQIEAHGVEEPGPDATEEERRRFDADRLGRTFHQRADAIEICQAWCADIYGRLWSATKTRGDEKVSERFYPPGKDRPSGQMIRGLLAVAAATGVTAHGLLPQSWN